MAKPDMVRMLSRLQEGADGLAQDDGGVNMLNHLPPFHSMILSYHRDCPVAFARSFLLVLARTFPNTRGLYTWQVTQAGYSTRPSAAQIPDSFSRIIS